MTLLAEPPRTVNVICAKYGLTPIEASQVVDRFGHQAEDHCAAVARRLRDDLKRLQGVHRVTNDIPALILAKHELVQDLMLREMLR